jgi:hypothetical protein
VTERRDIFGPNTIRRRGGVDLYRSQRFPELPNLDKRLLTCPIPQLPNLPAVSPNLPGRSFPVWTGHALSEVRTTGIAAINGALKTFGQLTLQEREKAKEAWNKAAEGLDPESDLNEVVARDSRGPVVRQSPAEKRLKEGAAHLGFDSFADLTLFREALSDGPQTTRNRTERRVELAFQGRGGS